jgi:nitrile hydratase subunit alpha
MRRLNESWRTSSTVNTRTRRGGGMQHDLGGQDLGEILVTDHPLTYWEYSIHALLVILAQKTPSLMTTDELRRGVESLEPNAYSGWGYYEKWSASMTQILLERGAILQDELDLELLGSASQSANEAAEPAFRPGDLIQVKSEDTRTRWRKPHLRCPGYVFQCPGVIERYIGKFDDPFLLAFRGHGPQQHLYCVSFYLRDLWPEGCDASCIDKVTLDIYEGWLLPREERDARVDVAISLEDHSARHHDHDHDHGHDHHHDGHDHNHSHDHSQDHDTEHDHDHGHFHESRVEIECKALEREGEDTPGKIIGEALLRTLFKKGITSEQQVREVVMKLEGLSTRLAGADLVVKAWMEPDYKARLLENGETYLSLSLTVSLDLCP